MSNTIIAKNTQQLLHSQLIESSKIESPEKLSEAEIIDDINKKVADIRKDHKEMLQKMDEMIGMLKEKMSQDKSANNSSSQNLPA